MKILRIRNMYLHRMPVARMSEKKLPGVQPQLSKQRYFGLAGSLVTGCRPERHSGSRLAYRAQSA
jgi:hypothetical protein